MYRVTLTLSAWKDLKSFKKSDQKQIVRGIDEQLIYEPSTETRNRKLLRPNKTAGWELRIE
jgi:mRNA-degrading endonuclease RelE of RelBE toxin-antitoxin system